MHRTPSGRLLIAILSVGALLQLVFFLRAWVGNDTPVMMMTGITFAEEGVLRPVSKRMSGGGQIPGALLQLLIGVPLKVYPHYKSPIAVISVFHLIAAAVLVHVLSRAIGLRFTVAYMAVYWLSPWRLYHSGLLQELPFLYLLSALHLWACWGLSQRPRFLPSVVLGLTVICTPQIHGSFLILWLLTFAIWLKGLIKVNYWGLGLGFVLGGLTLIPTLVAVLHGTLPSVSPTDAYLGRSLVRIFPPLKSLLLWVRYGSLEVGRLLTRTLYFSDAWASVSSARSVVAILAKSLYALGIASAVLCAYASWDYFRRRPEREEESDHQENRDWLRRYALFALLAMFLASCASPVTMQHWHMVLGLHAACIPVAHWIESNWSKPGVLCRWIILAFILLRLPTASVIAFGHKWYRVGRPGWTAEEFNRQMPEKYQIRRSPQTPADSLETVD